MTTGEKIRELRTALGMTQSDLGRLIGKQKAAVNKYETGQIVNLKRSVLEDLALALHCSPAYLLDLSDNSYEEFMDRYVLPDLGELSPYERSVVHQLRDLTPEGKDYISQQLQIASKMFKEE